jgi:hypothetical protein
VVVLVAALVALGVGCGEPAQYRFGVNLSGLLFAPTGPSEGIYPDRSVLRDPGNPFATYPLGPNTKWDLLPPAPGSPLLDVSEVAAFYAWATALTAEPTGENQYYTALMLAALSSRPYLLVDPSLDGGVRQTREMAIAGFQRMLDAFPYAVTYDKSGTVAYPLATPAYLSIRALGGQVTGGWVLVTGPGGPVATYPTGAVPAFDGGT